MSKIKLDDGHEMEVRQMAGPEPADQPRAEKVAPKSDKDKGGLAGRSVVYVDIDDDITSIIGKVKNAAQPVVALVPPKRIGALQSVVNLKLLQRAAKNARKSLALISQEPALTTLAAGLKIPVAKNVSEQAELIKPARDDDDDVSSETIDGSDIAIGDYAKMGDDKPRRRTDEDVSAAVAAIETDDLLKNDRDADGEPDPTPHGPKKSKKNLIPNFDTFRKKLLILGSLGVVLIAFLVWAIVFAPHATITITATTVPKTVDVELNLTPNQASQPDDQALQPLTKQIKKTETVNFAATGTKETGEKATGTVVLYAIKNQLPITLNAGTTLSTNGLSFTTDKTVTIGTDITACNIVGDGIYCSASVTTTATNIGEDFNIKKDATLAVAGYAVDQVYAVSSQAFTGGSKSTVKVVQQSDVDAATQKLKDIDNSTAMKKELTAQLGNNVTVIEASFAATPGDVITKPAVGEQIDNNGTASATLETTYTLSAVSNSDLNKVLDAAALATMDNAKNQKVYDNGRVKIKWLSYQANQDGSATAKLRTTAAVGPTLDENAIKKNAVGLRVGEIRANLGNISGVDSVDVKFSPFWVSTAPKADKIKVEFKVNE
jgi:hypothetical protein